MVMLRQKFTAVIRSTGGAIAPIAALTLLAILLVTVVALDISRAVSSEVKAQAVSDSAALNAVSLVRAKIDEGNHQNLDYDEIEKMAYDAFAEQISSHALNLKNLDVDFKIEGDEYIVKVDYEVQFDRTLSGDPVTIKNSTTAVTNYLQVSTYMDIHLLVDMSSSMSTGATVDDQIRLWRADGCAFACHASTIQRARSNNIALRQDKLASALRTLGNVADAAIDDFGLEQDSTKFNIWKFSTNVRSGGSTTNITSFKTLADRVNNETPSGSTNISGALDWLSRWRLPESGDGFTPDTRKTFVFLITDGISSSGSRLHMTAGRGTLNPAYCQKVKDSGATMAVIYTKYENYADTYRMAWGDGASRIGGHGGWTYNNWRNHYNKYVNTPLFHMSSELQKCADTDFYFETNSPAELNAALEQLYQNAIEKTKGAPRVAS